MAGKSYCAYPVGSVGSPTVGAYGGVEEEEIAGLDERRESNSKHIKAELIEP